MEQKYKQPPNKKILLVDDEENILHALTRVLINWSDENDIDLITAGSGIEALKILENENKNIVLIISDLKMPDLKGSDLLLKVKSLYPNIITILLTGFSETEEMIKAIKAGIFSYIMKPWDNNYLIAEIQKALDIYILKENNRKNFELIQEELRLAGRLQKNLLKADLPESELVSFSVTYIPLPQLNCGGDYYDIISLGNNRYLVLIGDVAGHGIKAAFITTILKSIIYSEYVKENNKPDLSMADFLIWLNNRVCTELRNVSDMLVTFSACLIDLNKATLDFANAGHLPIYIIRKGKVEKLHIPGSGFGFSKDIQYNQKTVKIERNDKIVLYTDGLTEADRFSNEIDNIFSNILLDSITDNNFNSKIIESIKHRVSLENFLDDVTVISIDIKE